VPDSNDFFNVTRPALIALAVLAAAWPDAAPAAAPAERPPQAPAPLSMEALPLTHVREGTVQGCGMRLTGGEAKAPASSWFDVSVNVFRRGVGLAQSIAYEIRRSEADDGESRPARVPIQRTWVKAREGGTRLGENTERRDTLVYTLLVDDVLVLFEAVATGRPVTLGIQRWGQLDAVYTATPALTDDSRNEMSACLAKLSVD